MYTGSYKNARYHWRTKPEITQELLAVELAHVWRRDITVYLSSTHASTPPLRRMRRRHPSNNDKPTLYLLNGKEILQVVRDSQELAVVHRVRDVGQEKLSSVDLPWFKVLHVCAWLHVNQVMYMHVHVHVYL